MIKNSLGKKGIGEVIEASVSNVTIAANDTVYNLASLPVPKGRWLILASAESAAANGSTVYVSIALATTFLDELTTVLGNSVSGSGARSTTWRILDTEGQTVYLTSKHANWSGNVINYAAGTRLAAIRIG